MAETVSSLSQPSLARKRTEMPEGGHYRLGVQFLFENEPFARAFGLESAQGAALTALIEGSPAAAAGLRVGDLVVRLGGRTVERPIEFSQIVNETPSDIPVAIEIIRVGAGIDDLISNLRLLAGRDEPDALIGLGELALAGAGGPVDRDEAVRLMRRAAEQGHSPAARRLGNVHLNGIGGPVDHAQATRWYRMAAGRGDAEARHWLGWMHWNGQYWTGSETAQNYGEAVRLFRAAAAAGISRSYLYLGLAHHQGRGTARNPAEAAQWYRRAIEAHGAPLAMLNLGELYYHGRGVAQDYAEAHRLFETAAALGNNARAKYMLARLYRDGHGVAVDRNRAKDLYRQASNEGEAGATLDLGIMLFNSSSNSEKREAVPLLRKASEAGLAYADYALAYAYSLGQGVGRDNRQVARYMARAVERGDAQALTEMKTNSAAWPREAVVTVQQMLRDKGFYQAAIDGRVGPATRVALEAHEAALRAR